MQARCPTHSNPNTIFLYKKLSILYEAFVLQIMHKGAGDIIERVAPALSDQDSTPGTPCGPRVLPGETMRAEPGERPEHPYKGN